MPNRINFATGIEFKRLFSTSTESPRHTDRFFSSFSKGEEDTLILKFVGLTTKDDGRDSTASRVLGKKAH